MGETPMLQKAVAAKTTPSSLDALAAGLYAYMNERIAYVPADGQKGITAHRTHVMHERFDMCNNTKFSIYND